MTNIYVLRLEGGNYYVGKTDNIYKRYEEHLNGSGSAWTRKHAPISLVKTVESASPFDEDKITKEYMATYGVNKVRGGSYVSVELSEVQKQSINAEIRGAKDLCTRCGRNSHFVKDCYATTESYGQGIEYGDEWGCDYCDITFTSEYRCMIHEKSCKNKQVNNIPMTPRYVEQKSVSACYRCGRTGHSIKNCYAKTVVDRRSVRYDSDDDSDDDSDYYSD